MNPLVVYPRKNQGKIAAYMGLSRDTAPCRHDPEEVMAFVEQSPGIPSGALITGVGFHKSGRDRTSQIIFVNSGRCALPRFQDFRVLVRKFVRRLARQFGQRVVLLEEIKPDGTYHMSEWAEHSTFPTKNARREVKAHLVKAVRTGVADAMTQKG